MVMNDKSCVPKVKALAKTLNKSIKELEQSFQAKRERFGENIVPKIVATCSKIVHLIQEEGDTVIKDCKRTKHLAYVKGMVERSTAMFARLTEWIQSFSDFAPKTTLLISEWMGRMRKVVSKVLAYAVKLGDFLDAHKYRILIGFLSAWLAYRNQTTLNQIYDFPLGDGFWPGMKAAVKVFQGVACKVDYDQDVMIIVSLTALYSMHCEVMRLKYAARKNMRDGFNQALQKNAAKKFFKESLGDSNLSDELAFAYADAFESADVIMLAQAGHFGVDAVDRLKHFVLMITSFLKGSNKVIQQLWRALNKTTLVVLLAFRLACQVGDIVYDTKEGIMNAIDNAHGMKLTTRLVWRPLKATVDYMYNNLPDMPSAEKATPTPIPVTLIHRRDVRLGPMLLYFFSKYGGYYFGSHAGWYVLKKLSLAFHDHTNRAVLKEDAIHAVVTGLSNPLSLEELVDNTEEAVAKLTGNYTIRKKEKEKD